MLVVKPEPIDLTLDSDGDDEQPVVLSPGKPHSPRVKEELSESSAALAALRQPDQSQPFPSTPATPGPPSSSNRTDTPSQYRSALFDGPTIFANQQDFFDACAANLQQQFGFEAIPSKQKPTQISTRCPKHKTDGCPFRVCAALCDSGRWAVALRSCVWTHSHPPTKTSRIAKAVVEEAKAEVAQTAPPPPASTSTTAFDQPTNVYDLIPDFPKLSDTWSSVKDAFQTFVRATVPVYGVSMHYHQTSDQGVRIRCNRNKQLFAARPGGMCPFSIFLDRKTADGRWRMRSADSNLQHSHGPVGQILNDPAWRPLVKDAEAREALGLAPLPPKKRKSAAPPVKDSSTSQAAEKEVDELDDSGASLVAEDEASAAGPAIAGPSTAIGSANDPPGLPQPGDVFPSFVAVYQAYVKAYISTWGIGVWKSFPTLGCNRARCPWMAHVEACGGGFAVNADRSRLQHDHGPHENILADPSWRPVVFNIDARAALGWGLARKKPRFSGQLPLEKSPSPALNPSPSFAPPAAQSKLRDALSHGATLGHGSPSPALDLHPSPASTDFSTELSAFLFALHPSVALLAQPLSLAGIDGLPSLIHLASLGPGLLDSFLDEVRLAHELEALRAPQQRPVSVVQWRLLAKLLKEGRVQALRA
ncbi:hypothetical protein Rhopal_001264-T1 [Rhodotorula paludigena]|uniref:Transposase MuDR plant domain-containing protein n=1 Tax=Rhodotorula paludigena TaxID=86838 RepID=A0AAV5GCV0_9BASI|nr:hypothetical protein Rhopal_001264-T1 [Rhodotorula paludigena]